MSHDVSDVIGQFRTNDKGDGHTLDECTDFFVEVLQSESEVTESWSVCRGQRPAPPHQHKPAARERECERERERERGRERESAREREKERVKDRPRVIGERGGCGLHILGAVLGLLQSET